MQYPSMHRDRTHPYPAAIRPGWVESSGLPSTDNDNRELFRARVSRFIDLFPDTMVIQEKTISIIRRDAFGYHVETVAVGDIERIDYSDTILFAGLELINGSDDHEIHIWGFRKLDALKAKSLMDDLIKNYRG